MSAPLEYRTVHNKLSRRTFVNSVASSASLLFANRLFGEPAPDASEDRPQSSNGSARSAAIVEGKEAGRFVARDIPA